MSERREAGRRSALLPRRHPGPARGRGADGDRRPLRAAARPRGVVGVDVFFVLSGFLITCCCSPSRAHRPAASCAPSAPAGRGGCCRRRPRPGGHRRSRRPRRPRRRHGAGRARVTVFAATSALTGFGTALRARHVLAASTTGRWRWRSSSTSPGRSSWSPACWSSGRRRAVAGRPGRCAVVGRRRSPRPSATPSGSPTPSPSPPTSPPPPAPGSSASARSRPSPAPASARPWGPRARALLATDRPGRHRPGRDDLRQDDPVARRVRRRARRGHRDGPARRRCVAPARSSAPAPGPSACSASARCARSATGPPPSTCGTGRCSSCSRRATARSRPIARLDLVLLALALAALTYRLVEQPLRNPVRLPRRRALSLYPASVCLLALTCGLGWTWAEQQATTYGDGPALTFAELRAAQDRHRRRQPRPRRRARAGLGLRRRARAAGAPRAAPGPPRPGRQHRRGRRLRLQPGRRRARSAPAATPRRPVDRGHR